MSPFTMGGYTASEVFDHTSTLLLLEKLFGVPVPNVSDWRRSTVGDMTSALALGKPAQPVPPVLPDASLTVPVVDEEVVVNALTGTFDEGFTYAPPAQNVMPAQETTPARPAPPR
jgi:phospholipase C